MGRESRANPNKPTDPPMEPLKDSTRWFESDPRAIQREPDHAVLIVRVGIAVNALNAQMDVGVAHEDASAAVQMRTRLWGLVGAAAVTNEGIRLAGQNMATLRAMAQRTHISEERLDQIGKLCAGKHPASATLKRARNQLGFHWDDEIVRPVVIAHGKNKKIVWLEARGEEAPVHRLAANVLGLALIPEAVALSDEESQPVISDALQQVSDAMGILLEFFTACVYGYFRTAGVTAQTREDEGV
jgi:hypothetical protein